METPFVFGRIASGEEFTDRSEDLKHLADNYISRINTIIISPRRWGKSSLVNKAAQLVAKKDKSHRFCFVDLYNVRTEEQFYQSLAQEVIKASSSKWEERMEDTKHFMSRFIPRLTYSPAPDNDFSIGLDWKEVQKHPDEIIDLAERISDRKKISLTVCIDEFQNITAFSDPVAFQKKLRSHWQKHRSASYCLYGSKRHMMMDVFTSPSMPFYKFGDLIFLEKISEVHWVSFITQRFQDTHKRISGQNAALIAQSAENHPYYVQQLAQQAWLHSSNTCSREIILHALDTLLLQMSLLFQNITDSLSTTQVNFLQALLDDAQKISSKNMLHQYRLGTSANVLRIKQGLVNKEILDINGADISFLDPMYKHWLRKYYFR